MYSIFTSISSNKCPTLKIQKYDLLICPPKNNQYPPDRISLKSNTQINNRVENSISRVKINHQHSVHLRAQKTETPSRKCK